MATAAVEKPAYDASGFMRAAAAACREALHATHEARLLKTIAADAVETRVYEAAHYIRKHPFASIAAAFAAGVPIGAMVGWACTHNRKAHT